MEVTQFTYFQQVGGFECNPVPVEIAYGLERLTMYIQGVDSMFDIVWSRGADGVNFTYGDVYLSLIHILSNALVKVHLKNE